MADLIDARPKIKFFRDVLFKYIAVSEDELKMVDTVEFQALRDIRQLGVAHYVFTSATHTRFQHSLQVCHVSSVFMETLARNQPELKITRRMIQLVRCAALVHDIGHGPFSHSFDAYVAPLLALKLPHHEQRSCALFRYMVVKYALGYNEAEVDLVCHLICGDPCAGFPRWLFQIVANKDFEIDADKLCYLSLDSFMIGTPRDLQSERLFEHARVINDYICFHCKTAELIVDVFRCRADMFLKIYRHHSVVGIEAMVCDILCILAKTQKWHDLFNSENHEWRTLTDSVLLSLPRVDAKGVSTEMQRALHIFQRLQNRQLYSCRAQTNQDLSEGTTCIVLEHGFAGGDTNPLQKVKCYEMDKDTGRPKGTKSLLECNVSSVGLNVPVQKNTYEINRGALRRPVTPTRVDEVCAPEHKTR